MHQKKHKTLNVTSSLVSSLPDPQQNSRWKGHCCLTGSAIPILISTIGNNLQNKKTYLYFTLFQPFCYHRRCFSHWLYWAILHTIRANIYIVFNQSTASTVKKKQLSTCNHEWWLLTYKPDLQTWSKSVKANQHVKHLGITLSYCSKVILQTHTEIHTPDYLLHL